MKPGRARRAPAWILVSLIRAYQALRSGRPPSCRYLPTCSQYALEAVERHGAGRGAWLAARRLARCHPLAGHGVDPVPPVAPAGRRAPGRPAPRVTSA